MSLVNVFIHKGPLPLPEPPVLPILTKVSLLMLVINHVQSVMEPCP